MREGENNKKWEDFTSCGLGSRVSTMQSSSGTSFENKHPAVSIQIFTDMKRNVTLQGAARIHVCKHEAADSYAKTKARNTRSLGFG